MPRGSDDVVSVTSVPQSAAEEQRGRQRRYLASMSLRTVCFVGAIVVGDHWYRWVLVAGALVLPYIAVVSANAVTARRPSASPESPDIQRSALPPRV